MITDTDFMAAFDKACAGTVHGRAEDRKELRLRVMSTFIRQPPKQTVAHLADRIRDRLRREGGEQEVMRIAVDFLSALPPETAVKTVVGGLWV